MRLTLALALTVALGACNSLRGKGDLEIDGVLIPQAAGFIEAPEGPTVTMAADQKPEDIALPDGERVRLAMARDVTYRDAKAMIERVRAAGKEPVLLVGKRYKLKAFVLNDTLANPRTAIRMVVTADGKACIAPPDNPESICVEQSLSNHVSTASVREFIREAVRGYSLNDVRVFARPTVEWADVVRAIDGARTCCKDTVVRARLVDAES